MKEIDQNPERGRFDLPGRGGGGILNPRVHVLGDVTAVLRVWHNMVVQIVLVVQNHFKYKFSVELA